LLYIHTHTRIYINIYIYICIYTHTYIRTTAHTTQQPRKAERYILKGSAKEPYKRDDILQKRPIILRSLLIVATPYQFENASFVSGGCVALSEFVRSLSAKEPIIIVLFCGTLQNITLGLAWLLRCMCCRTNVCMCVHTYIYIYIIYTCTYVYFRGCFSIRVFAMLATFNVLSYECTRKNMCIYVCVYI